MSRLGKKPIQIPEGVKVTVEGNKIKVNGTKGELVYEKRPEIDVRVEGEEVVSGIKIDTKNSNAFWGLTCSIVKNMIEGVEKGFEKKLELVGVGYRVKSLGDRKISMTVGYSHPVEFEAPEGIKLEVDGNKDIAVTGIDKQLVGLTTAQIRKIRKPEPYKGKGIKYTDEVIRKKAGKAGKV